MSSTRGIVFKSPSLQVNPPSGWFSTLQVSTRQGLRDTRANIASNAVTSLNRIFVTAMVFWKRCLTIFPMVMMTILIWSVETFLVKLRERGFHPRVRQAPRTIRSNHSYEAYSQYFNLLPLLDLTKRAESSSFACYENLMWSITFAVILFDIKSKFITSFCWKQKIFKNICTF